MDIISQRVMVDNMTRFLDKEVKNKILQEIEMVKDLSEQQILSKETIALIILKYSSIK